MESARDRPRRRHRPGDGTDAAADLLGDLSEDRTEKSWYRCNRKRREVADLLEFGENTAAGRMATEYNRLPVTATAHDALQAMHNFRAAWRA